MSQFYDSASLVLVPSGYKSQKIYSQKPLTADGQLTFSRSSNASRIGPDGLIQKVHTNELLQSNTFDNVAWSKLTSGTASSPVVTANHTTAPDGTTTAERVQFLRTGTASGDYSLLTQNYTTSQISTGSIYLKSLTGSAQNVLFYWSIGQGQVFSIGTDWTRIELPFTSIGLGSFAVGTRGGSGFNAGGDLSIDVAIWGAQLETGDIATDYIATTSAAVSVGPVADLPRLSYDPANPTCPSLILEGQRTNLALFSEQMDNASWIKLNGSVTANAALSPDGYTNADSFIPNTTSGVHALRSNLFNQSATAAHSWFVKANGYTKVAVRESEQVGNYASFNLSTGTLISTNQTGSIVSYGNGWYRLTLVDTTTLANCQTSIVVLPDSYTTGDPIINWSGDGVKGVFAFGAQVEIGAYATSYIGPTLAAATTRGADSAEKTGISSLIGQTEGTLFVEFESGPDDATNHILSLSDGTTSNRVSLVKNTSDDLRAFVASGGASQASILWPNYAPNTNIKAAISYKANEIKFYANGENAGTDTSALVPASLTQVEFETSGSPFAYPIKQLIVFPTALTATQLAELTSL